MSFVKLDCGILDSTLWSDREAREIFITSLLMAAPHEIKEPTKTIKIRSLDYGGYTIPPGFYGFVAAASTGIIRRAGVEQEAGLAAIERLSSQDLESRTPDHEGRRLVRVDGGFIVLNFDKYRKKDHTAAERSKRYRENLSTRVSSVASRVTARSVTQAEAEAEAEAEEESLSVQPPSQNNNTLDEKQIVSPTAPPCETKKRWEKPTLEQVTLQAAKIGLPKEEADKFFNYYESNGWRVGKNPMKSWVHALTNWSVNFRQRSFVASPYFKPDAKPEKPLPTIADLRAKRLQDDQNHLPGTILPSRDSNATKGHPGGNAGHS